MNDILPALFVFNGDFNGKMTRFEYHVGKWLEYDRSGYNSSHPSLGSLLMVWCIELTFSGTFRSFPTCLEMAKMDINLHLSPMPVSHIQVVDLSFPFWSSFSLDILFKVVIGVILLLIMMTLPFWFYQIYLCIAGEIIWCGFPFRQFLFFRDPLELCCCS